MSQTRANTTETSLQTINSLRLCAHAIKSIRDAHRASITRQATKAISPEQSDVHEGAVDLLLRAERMRKKIPLKKLKEITSEGMAALAREIKNIPQPESLFTTAQRKKIASAAQKRREVQNVEEIFGDQDRIYMKPVKSTAISETQEQVTALLSWQGYTVLDYNAGYATDNKGKQRFKIGKLLKDQPALAAAFSQDKTRSSENLLIVITRNADDIARMSTGRAWHSCMAADKKNFVYVPNDIQSGTLAAYLVSENDPEINDPVARTLIKPYVSRQWGDQALLATRSLHHEFFGAGRKLSVVFQRAAIHAVRFLIAPFQKKTQTIMLPEKKTYGIKNHEFTETVRCFTEALISGKPDGEYGLAPGLYEDGAGMKICKKGPAIKIIDA